MIDVILSARCVRKLKRELKNAGQNEIGGVMAAEQIADGRSVALPVSEADPASSRPLAKTAIGAYLRSCAPPPAVSPP